MASTADSNADTDTETDTDTDPSSDDDRFRHIARGYYWDTDAITTWKLLMTTVSLIAYPPIGAFFFGLFSIMAITSDPTDE